MASIETPTTGKLDERFIRSIRPMVQLIGKKSTTDGRVILEAEQPARYKDTKRLLDWLDLVVTAQTMTPKFKQDHAVGKLLQFMYNHADVQFPAPYQQQAESLFNAFEAQSWGGAPAVEVETDDSEGDDEQNNQPQGPGGRPKKKPEPKPSTDIPPPADHPIWGRGKIMDGIVIRMYEDGTLRKVLRQAGSGAKAEVRGDANIAVGSWYPLQLATVAAGVHGLPQGGIYYAKGTAYSIVSSSAYDKVDKDLWDTVYYSAPNSHKNENKISPPPRTAATRALVQAKDDQQYIRVFRSGPGGDYAPREGVRYDGLYMVVDVKDEKNDLGGKYERFKLDRKPNQRSWNECKAIPTAEQLKQYNQIDYLFGDLARKDA